MQEDMAAELGVALALEMELAVDLVILLEQVFILGMVVLALVVAMRVLDSLWRYLRGHHQSSLLTPLNLEINPTIQRVGQRS